MTIPFAGCLCLMGMMMTEDCVVVGVRGFSWAKIHANHSCESVDKSF